MYNGGYDDMVSAEDQRSARGSKARTSSVRRRSLSSMTSSRASAPVPAPRQVNSRKKEVERLATSELARSNIARPFIRFDLVRPSGKHVLEFEQVNKSYTQKDGRTEHVISNFSASVTRGDKVILMGRNGQGKTTLLKALLANGPGD